MSLWMKRKLGMGKDKKEEKPEMRGTWMDNKEEGDSVDEALHEISQTNRNVQQFGEEEIKMINGRLHMLKRCNRRRKLVGISKKQFLR
jgi:TolA-binding protein